MHQNSNKNKYYPRLLENLNFSNALKHKKDIISDLSLDVFANNIGDDKQSLEMMNDQMQSEVHDINGIQDMHVMNSNVDDDISDDDDSGVLEEQDFNDFESSDVHSIVNVFQEYEKNNKTASKEEEVVEVYENLDMNKAMDINIELVEDDDDDGYDESDGIINDSDDDILQALFDTENTLKNEKDENTLKIDKNENTLKIDKNENTPKIEKKEIPKIIKIQNISKINKNMNSMNIEYDDDTSSEDSETSKNEESETNKNVSEDTDTDEEQMIANRYKLEDTDKYIEKPNEFLPVFPSQYLSKPLTIAILLRIHLNFITLENFYSSLYPSLLAFWNENISQTLIIILDENTSSSMQSKPKLFLNKKAYKKLRKIFSAGIYWYIEKLPSIFDQKNTQFTKNDEHQFSTLLLDLHLNRMISADNETITKFDILMIMDYNSPLVIIPEKADIISTENKIHCTLSNIQDRIIIDTKYISKNVSKKSYKILKHNWKQSTDFLLDSNVRKYSFDGRISYPQIFHRHTLQNFRKYFILQIMKKEKIDIFDDLEEDEIIELFSECFLKFAVEHKPYDVYTLLWHYAYFYEYKYYEWHIENWILTNDNLAHLQIANNWKYQKKITSANIQSTCCHLWFADGIYDDGGQCVKYKKYFASLLSFYHNFENDKRLLKAIDDEYSMENVRKWTVNDFEYGFLFERFEEMGHWVYAENYNHSIFSYESWKVKKEACVEIIRNGVENSFYDLKLAHMKQLIKSNSA